jgi:hypothetical protein
MRPLGLLLALAVVACGRAEQAPRSSPLLGMDSDRLWVLLQAAKVNPRCRELYAGSTDPRITGLAEKCGEVERRVVAWLAANDVEEPQLEELRDPTFWDWYHQKVEAIEACRAALVPGSSGYWTKYNGCDPFQRIVMVDGKSPADAGFRVPQGE